LALLGVILPVALILGSLLVGVHSIAVALVVLPLTIVDVAIDMEEDTFAVGEPFFPEALKPGTVGPLHLACAFSEATAHRAGVDCSRTLVLVCSLYKFVGRLTLAKSLFILLSLEVDTVGHLHKASSNFIFATLQKSSDASL
jgi:hypothetical protein